MLGDVKRTKPLLELLKRASLRTRSAATLDALEASVGPVRCLVVLADLASEIATKVERAVRALPEAAVVVVGSNLDRRATRAALSAGAAGVVLAERQEETLTPCVQAVMAGQTCVPRGFAQQVDPPPLSPREKQILGLVVMGYMNGQIAEQLYLAESTVKSHLSSAFGKLGVRSRTEAVQLIVDPQRGLGTGILSLVGQDQ